MLIPDINLLIYAYNVDTKYHNKSKKWLEDTFSSSSIVGVPWVVILGFIRLTTNAKIFKTPLSLDQVTQTVENWLKQNNVSLINPGINHYTIIKQLFYQTGYAGNLTTDTHIAALALEYNATICSNDKDFLRFSGLRIHNPLK